MDVDKLVAVLGCQPVRVVVILGLGILATVLVLGHTQGQTIGLIKAGTLGDQFLRTLVMLSPIFTTVLLGFSAFFRWGSKWILLRASAEALKREMYYYRTHTGEYSEASLQIDSEHVQEMANKLLSRKVSTINHHLLQTEINTIRNCVREQHFPLHKKSH